MGVGGWGGCMRCADFAMIILETRYFEVMSF